MDRETVLAIISAIGGIAGTLGISKLAPQLFERWGKGQDRRTASYDRLLARQETDLDAERTDNAALRAEVDRWQERAFQAELKLERERRNSEGWRRLANVGATTSERALALARETTTDQESAP